MIHNLLVPLDSSELAHRVLPHARALGGAFGANVALLHILERENKAGPEQVDPISWQLRKAEAQSYLNEAAQQWSGTDVSLETALLEGPAAGRIIEYAEEHSIDLLVLSTHGQSGLSQWTLSSVTQKVIAVAANSFLLVRAHRPIEGDEFRYQRIMVPLDGSKRAEVVLPFAARLAQAQEAELLLVHVVAQPQIIQSRPLAQKDSQLIERLASRNKIEARRYLELLETRLAYRAESRVLFGRNDCDSLLDFVDDESIDLVVASAHGTSGEQVRPYGSVVTSLISYSSAHLLVIQDFTHGEIRPTRAAMAARDQANGSSPIYGRTDRLTSWMRA